MIILIHFRFSVVFIKDTKCVDWTVSYYVPTMRSKCVTYFANANCVSTTSEKRFLVFDSVIEAPLLWNQYDKSVNQYDYKRKARTRIFSCDSIIIQILQLWQFFKTTTIMGIFLLTIRNSLFSLVNWFRKRRDDGSLPVDSGLQWFFIAQKYDPGDFWWWWC